MEVRARAPPPLAGHRMSSLRAAGSDRSPLPRRAARRTRARCLAAHVPDPRPARRAGGVHLHGGARLPRRARRRRQEAPPPRRRAAAALDPLVVLRHDHALGDQRRAQGHHAAHGQGDGALHLRVALREPVRARSVSLEPRPTAHRGPPPGSTARVLHSAHECRLVRAHCVRSGRHPPDGLLDEPPEVDAKRRADVELLAKLRAAKRALESLA